MNPADIAFVIDHEHLRIDARLCYRKMDQYLINFLFGEHSGLTSPITTMTAQSSVIELTQGRP